MEKNLYYLIGHPGAGKTTHAKHIKKQQEVNKTISYYENNELLDEDDEVVKISEFNSMLELISNVYVYKQAKYENVQDYYVEFYSILEDKYKNEKDTLFLLSTGGFSPIYDKEKFKNSNCLYIKTSIEDLKNTMKERLMIHKENVKNGIDSIEPEILILDDNYNIIQRKTNYTEEEFVDFYNKTNKLYEELAKGNVFFNDREEKTLESNSNKIITVINENLKK